MFYILHLINVLIHITLILTECMWQTNLFFLTNSSLQSELLLHKICSNWPKKWVKDSVVCSWIHFHVKNKCSILWATGGWLLYINLNKIWLVLNSCWKTCKNCFWSLVLLKGEVSHLWQCLFLCPTGCRFYHKSYHKCLTLNLRTQLCCFVWAANVASLVLPCELRKVRKRDGP